ncbi:MAG: 2-oxo-4-hydroxy-4-carboxy-5-ureidoimidazoline decarboxylase [Caulobacteraceae bacterium]
MSHGLHPILERANLVGRKVAAADRDQFLAVYGQLFDHSPWVVERAWDMRPFDDAKALHCAFLRVIAEASQGERRALAGAHPELADKLAIAQGLTEASAKEQASAGLDRLSPAEYEAFHALNRAYRDKHGIPFIICVKLNDRASILAAMRARLEQDSEAELDEAMTQVGLISRLRLADIKV